MKCSIGLAQTSRLPGRRKLNSVVLVVHATFSDEAMPECRIDPRTDIMFPDEQFPESADQESADRSLLAAAPPESCLLLGGALDMGTLPISMRDAESA
jgi:hypothetical protein